MAILILGMPGSGKSFYAVKHLKDNSSLYWKTFSNVDGLSRLVSQGLNFKIFYEHVLKPMHLSAKEAGARMGVNILDSLFETPEIYEGSFEILKRVGMLAKDASEDKRTLLIVDEAQDFFRKQDDVLNFFMTHHRHLYIELILMTQIYTGIHHEYRVFNEIVQARPKIKQLTEGFIIYDRYSSLPTTDENKGDKIVLKKDKAIFDLYKSGDKVTGPNFFKKYLIWLILAIVAFIALGYYFLSKFSNNSSTSPSSSSSTKYTPSSYSDNGNLVINDPSHKVYIFSIFNSYFTINDEIREYPLSVFAEIEKKFIVQNIENINTSYMIFEDKNISAKVIQSYNICRPGIEEFLINFIPISERKKDDTKK